MYSTNLKRHYDPTFVADEAYRATLPDLQNGPASLIEGANVPICQVGISGFRLPLHYPTRAGQRLFLETSVDGYVSLDAGVKGINMSRLMRSFYKFKDELFHQDVLEYVLRMYREDLKAKSAYVRLNLEYPIIQKSLRSEMEGYQYYTVGHEGHMDENGRFRRIMHLEFVYSSACPCSFELAEHARETREVVAIPHSQRSVAYITLELNEALFVEDLVDLCRDALQTETQVMVKREDEQAFAELNGAYQKFVEDAARLLFERLDTHAAVKDFVVRCVHMESLHSHDAVSRINKGVPGGLR